MTRTTHHLVLLAALALALLPGAAHARFGKSDKSDKSDDKHENSGNHSGNSASSDDHGGSYHSASPVGSDTTWRRNCGSICSIGTAGISKPSS